MPKPGEHADVLRALGRFFDDQHAVNVEIINHDAFLAVSWSSDGTADDQRAYEQHELEKLREQGRAMRQGAGGGTPGGTLAELLRTLGQEIDREQVDVSRIVQEQEGFVVSGSTGGKYHRELHLIEDLIELSTQRRSSRANERATRFWMWVKSGIAVYTQDDHLIGKVAEVRGRSFKIGAPLLQRDYWLPGEAIASITPEERIVLTFPFHQLDARKSHSAPPRQ